MKKRYLCFLLFLALVLSLLPETALAVDSADYSTTQGGLLSISLSELGLTGADVQLTIKLNGKDCVPGPQTKIKDGVLAFTESSVGIYELTLTDGPQSKTITIEVIAAAEGMERQYGYNEANQETVRVYVTISSDGIPLKGNDEGSTILAHHEIAVSYYDLAAFGLTDYYRYHTEGGKGPYIDGIVVERPTLLHLYLLLLQKYYMGVDGESGPSYPDFERSPLEWSAPMPVLWMNGETAYDASMKALNLTGGATSMYMQQFWGHDENLMYYRNHVYPLMSPGWGSCADYILLSDGDCIDLAMFSNWDFYHRGAFVAFDRDDYAVTAGELLRFDTVKFDTKSVAEGGAESFTPIQDMVVTVYDEHWEELDTPELEKDNHYTYTFDEPGTYYLLATDPDAGTEKACFAPATAKVTVAEASKPHDGHSRLLFETENNTQVYCETCGKYYQDTLCTEESSQLNLDPGAKKLTVREPDGAEDGQRLLAFYNQDGKLLNIQQGTTTSAVFSVPAVGFAKARLFSVGADWKPSRKPIDLYR